MAGRATNAERLAALEKQIERLINTLGSPASGVAAQPVQEVYLYGPDGSPLNPTPPPSPATQAATVINLPKAEARSSIDWTPIITALIGTVSAVLPALLQRPDPTEQLASLVTVMQEMKDDSTATAELLTAATPLLAMMRSAPGAGSALSGAKGNGNGHSGGDLAALFAAHGIDPASLGALFAGQTASDGANGPS